MFGKHETRMTPKSRWNPKGQKCHRHGIYYKGSYCNSCYKERRVRERHGR